MTARWSRSPFVPTRLRKCGNNSSFTNFSNSSGIDKIEVWVKNAVDNVRINFSVFSSNPQSSSIPNPEKVYQYLHITPENINNSLQNATIKFKVNRSWADNNSIKKENISLFKYFTNISQWEELATIYIGSDKNYYSYETNLSNFSYFAIAGNITANTGKNFFSQIIGDMQSFASSNEGKIILGIILVIIILITVVLSTLVRRLRRDAASSKEVYEKWGER